MKSNLYMDIVAIERVSFDSFRKKLKQIISLADNEGNIWIRKARQKTKIMCNIPLLDIPLAILDKYKGYPICEKKGTLLPVPCN